MRRKTTRSIKHSERREIVEEYLTGEETKVAIWRRYTGQEKEKGQLSRWMRQLGYKDEKPVSLIYMPKKKSKETPEELQRRIRELESQLLDSQLKEEAYRRMIEIAEKDLKISIQKKPDTK
jgi:hypothetical protein